MKCILYKKALPLILLSCLLLGACGNSKNDDVSKEPLSHTSTEKGTWDSAPKVLTPTADGTQTYTCDVATIDASNSSSGYIIVNYHGSNQKVKLQITGPDGVTYTFDLHGGNEVFPLVSSSGSYTVTVFENVEGTQYATVLSQVISVSITDEFGPYLYPNQYVNFTADSLAVKECSSLAYYCSSDTEVVESVYNYIISNFKYDYDKAKNVKSGYLPDVDKVFTENTGICFDYAAVMATMLRTQAIPTRLEVGYAGEEYHAWISTYIKDKGWINGIIEFDGTSWNMLDPTFASTSDSPKKFIAQKSDYITKYVY